MCCGKNRALLRQSQAASQQVARPAVAPIETGRDPSAALGVAARPSEREQVAPEVVFELRGSEAFVAVGGVTGKRYLFSGAGARVRVDARERELLAMIDGLVEVSESDAAV
jgi:hypothetical protein